jgi:hypothetical protein
LAPIGTKKLSYIDDTPVPKDSIALGVVAGENPERVKSHTQILNVQEQKYHHETRFVCRYLQRDFCLQCQSCSEPDQEHIESWN